MNSYCITLEVCSPLGTPLAADTLWGHIAWGIRWNQGVEVLTAWLNSYDTAPPLVLSDPLPVGYWPRPSLPPAARAAQPPTMEFASQRKRLAAVQWITHDAWQAISGDLSPQNLAEAISRGLSLQPAAHQTIGVVHAGINRLTGGTAQPGGGSLFAVERTFHGEPARFEAWVRSSATLDQVQTWFEQGLDGGYGHDAAIGAGQINVVAVRAAELPAVAGTNAGVALSGFTPAPGDPCRGFFKAGVRCGRLGGDFAIGSLPDGTSQRQKKPVAIFQTGTLLASDGIVPAICGRVLGGVHHWQPIRHYAMTLLLPCRLNADLLALPMLSPTPLQTASETP